MSDSIAENSGGSNQLHAQTCSPEPFQRDVEFLVGHAHDASVHVAQGVVGVSLRVTPNLLRNVGNQLNQTGNGSMILNYPVSFLRLRPINVK